MEVRYALSVNSFPDSVLEIPVLPIHLPACDWSCTCFLCPPSGMRTWLHPILFCSLQLAPDLCFGILTLSATAGLQLLALTSCPLQHMIIQSFEYSKYLKAPSFKSDSWIHNVLGRGLSWESEDLCSGLGSAACW